MHYCGFGIYILLICAQHILYHKHITLKTIELIPVLMIPMMSVVDWGRGDGGGNDVPSEILNLLTYK